MLNILRTGGRISRYSGSALRRKVAKLGQATFAAGALVAGTAIGAMAQTTPVPQRFSTVQGGAASVTLTGLPTTTTTDGTLSLDIFGDVDGGIAGGEMLAISVDGVLLTNFQGGGAVSCISFPTTNINIPQATLAPLITDGQLVVSYLGTAGVNAICDGTPVGVPAPPNVSYVVSGSLTYTGGMPPGPGGGTASDSVAQFLENRARSLRQNQPDVMRFVDGRTSGEFNADVTQGSAQLSFGTAARGPFWFDLSGSRTDSGANEQTYFLGSVGGHLQLGGNTIAGVMLQFDHAEDTVTGGDRVSGNGWLVGPYFASQITDFPLYLDGRLLYGKTDNEITPFGSPTDSFDGERWLASLGLEGRVPMQTITMFPGLDISHVRDKQNAYTDSTPALIPSQEVEQTEVALSLDFEMPVASTSSDLVLTWGVSGIWSDTNGTGTSPAIVGVNDGWRGRVDAGLNFSGPNGLTANANVFLDGLGDSGLESYGLSATVNLSF